MTALLAEPLELFNAPGSLRRPASRGPHPAGDRAERKHADPMAAAVLAALRSKLPGRRGRERRSERRYPYPYPLYLTPLTSEGPRIEETVQVLGKHLSEHGLDFYHCEPLPYRRMIASLPVEGGWMGLVLDLKWCRFTAEGLYDNGGRFVAAVPSPLG